MVSKKNNRLKTLRSKNTKQHFALRKLSVGVASVLVGLTFAGLGNETAKADQVTPPTA